MSLSSPASTFVGRQGELALLQAKLDDACAGRGSVVMLLGEAGIGKTATAQTFAAAARRNGAVVLWGACFEGEWQPPYGPWAEALAGYARTLAPERLRRELGAGAPPLAQLVRSVRAVLPDTPLAATLNPDEARFRLYDAVTQWLLAATQEQPVVLILDDLHWADRDSLWLLRHVARFVARGRLLVLGLYRDPELDVHHRHPLGDVLAVLRRETDYARLVLRGLDEPQVAEYLAGAAGQELPQALTQAIFAETAGNPFYMREVFRHLVEEGKIVHRAGRWSTDFSINELGIPDSVRQVLRRRLSRLSMETNTVLRYAAAFTGGFASRVLLALTAMPEEALLDCLDEALQAGLIRPLAEPALAYDFVHAIVRHTLYDELNPDRKARLHRRIAEALEQVPGGREREHAAELATQYHASAALPGAACGIPYALTAADEARARAAHERAVTFLRLARDLAVGGEAPERAAILCQLAIAEAEALLLAEAQRTVEEALGALTDAGSTPAARAGFLASVARILKDGGALRAIWEPLVQHGLALIAPRRDLVWARLALLLDHVEPLSSGVMHVSRWLGYDPDAIAIARTNGDEEDYARTLEPLDWRSRAETEEVLRLARTWRRPAAILRALEVVLRDFVYRHGDMREATARSRELLAVSERFGSIPGQVEALAQLALCQTVLGELALAQQTHQRAREMVRRLGSGHRLHVVVNLAVATILAYYLGGDWPALAADAAQLIADPETSWGVLGLTAASFAVINHCFAGNIAETRRFLAVLTPVLERSDPRMYLYTGALYLATAAVWYLGAVEFAAPYRQLARMLAKAGVGPGPMGTHELAIARMAALLGELDDAVAGFAQTRESLATNGQRPLRATVDYDEALALIRAGADDHARVMILLERAITEFRALGMSAWEQRALAQRGWLNVARPGGGPVDHQYPDRLTSREVEVLRSVAAGKANREIAAELFLSVPTVQRHIANIYAKIGVHGRAAATAYALRHNIAPERPT